MTTDSQRYVVVFTHYGVFFRVATAEDHEDDTFTREEAIKHAEEYNGPWMIEQFNVAHKSVAVA